jgi:hypothetical protein
MEVSVAHIRKDWRFPSFGATPYFYFLKDGNIVAAFQGWPKEGNKARLVEALDRVSGVVKPLPTQPQ